MNRFITLSFFISLCLFFSGVCGKCENPEERLLEFLLDDYEKSVRPVPPENENSTKVSIGLSLISIDDYDTDSKELTSMVWLSLKWKDSRLAWNDYGEKFGEVKKLHVVPSDIWTPDIVLFNGLKPFEPQIPERLLTVIERTGTIFLIIPSNLEIKCSETDDIDKVRCTYKFMSWTYDGGEVELSLDYGGLSLDDYQPKNGLKIVGNSTNVNARYYACCPEPYYDVQFVIDIGIDSQGSEESMQKD